MRDLIRHFFLGLANGTRYQNEKANYINYIINIDARHTALTLTRVYLSSPSLNPRTNSKTKEKPNERTKSKFTFVVLQLVQCFLAGNMLNLC